MKSVKIIPILALSVLFVCCANSSTPPPDTPIDVKSFGLVGNVKKVTVTVSELVDGKEVDPWEDATQSLEFDENGRILKDRFDNIYEYDEKGNFIKGVSEYSKMQRDAKGRIITYENWKDDEDDEGFTINIGYDEMDRIVKVEIGAWEATVDQVYTFSDDHIYPDHANWESDDEGDFYSTDMTYTYKKFDSHGNWTEREIHTLSKHTVEGEDINDSREEKSIERREIIYY